MQNIRSVTPNRVMTHRLRNTGRAGNVGENDVLGRHTAHTKVRRRRQVTELQWWPGSKEDAGKGWRAVGTGPRQGRPMKRS